LQVIAVPQALLWAAGRRTHPLRTLWPREVGGLPAVAQGPSTAAIAESIVLTESPVEKDLGSDLWQARRGGA